MPYFCREKIGRDTITWIVYRTSVEQISGRRARDPTGQGSRWTDFKECSGTCSCKYTPLGGSVAPQSCKNRRGKEPGSQIWDKYMFSRTLRIWRYSSGGSGVEKVHQRPSGPLFIKCFKRFLFWNVIYCINYEDLLQDKILGLRGWGSPKVIEGQPKGFAFLYKYRRV